MTDWAKDHADRAAKKAKWYAANKERIAAKRKGSYAQLSAREKAERQKRVEAWQAAHPDYGLKYMAKYSKTLAGLITRLKSALRAFKLKEQDIEDLVEQALKRQNKN